jgi:peptidoglycan hydrolase-like protein with peptidoglycan-binding domain
MLVNALNHMNRKSGSYVFVDQALEKATGQMAILTTRGIKKEYFPSLYFRGAITQVDSNVVSDSASLSLDLTNVLKPPRLLGTNVEKSDKSGSRGVSVVSVDLHLVRYPSRQVIPGGSVANSMVVVSDGSGFAGEGEIKLAGIELSVKISRVESVGQAVRNLIELATLELIGRHSGLPYWECLATRPSNEKATNGAFLKYNLLTEMQKYTQIQNMLTRLGLYDGPITTWLDPETRDAVSRFQAQEKLIATGNVDFDLYERLRERTRGIPIENVRPPRSLATPQPEPKGTRKQAIQTGVRVKNPSRLITLMPMQKTYKKGDVLKARLTVAKPGYISCFHQAGNGTFTQILPVNPNERMSILKASALQVPLTTSNFDIVIEQETTSENIVCMLDQSETPKTTATSLGASSTLAPTRVSSIKELINAYSGGQHKIAWASLSSLYNPK